MSFKDATRSLRSAAAAAVLVCVVFPTSPVFGATLAERLSGRVLLAVEDRGAAWYVDPVTRLRFSLGTSSVALATLQSFSLGISDSDLARIPVVGSTMVGDMALRTRLAGRVVLAVASHGATWYVDPVSLRRVYFGTPDDAMRLLRTYGLGITNADLALLPGNDGVTMQHDVPFTAQAPLGEWSDPRQQEGCEEASVLMAVAWARGETLTATAARDAIVAMSEWERARYGTYYDTSVDDTADRLLRGYMDYDKVAVRHDVTVEDIRHALEDGVVLVAVDGQKLDNPNFVGAGPARHMLVVTGYDAATDTFVTNDPGTQFGAGYRYTAATLGAALRDYPSGNHAPLTPMPTAMIVVTR